MIFRLTPDERREYLLVLLSKGRAAAQEWLDQKNVKPVYATIKTITKEQIEVISKCLEKWPSWDNSTREQRAQMKQCLKDAGLD